MYSDVTLYRIYLKMRESYFWFIVLHGALALSHLQYSVKAIDMTDISY